MRVKALIRRLIILGVLNPLPLCAAAPVTYRFALEVAASKPALTVELRFQGNASGTTVIALPDKWAGTRELYRNLTGLTLSGGILLPGKDEAHRIAKARANVPLILRYRVVDNRAADPSADYEKASPILRTDWVYVHAEGAVASPEGREDAPARVIFAPPPKGWRIVSDLERPEHGNLTVTDIGGAIIVGGRHLRLTERKIGIARLRVATLGRWPFTDDAFADNIAKLMVTENTTLAAPAIDFLVTLGPLTGSEVGATSHGGTGRTAGFAMLATDNVPLNDFTRTLAHEYAHRWFGRAFGPNTDGAHDYLFSEGFNDWFAARAMVTSGLWTTSEWAEALNLVLVRYGSSTARGLSEAAITERFWTDPDAMQLQYDRGNLTALLLDQRLRANGGSGVIPLLRRMKDGRDEERDRIERLADAAMPGAFAAAGHEALGGLPEGSLMECGVLRWVERPAYGRGFEIGDKRKVVAITKGSGAEAAGIRPGMFYRRRISFHYLDSTVPYVAEFDDDGTLRTISWLPSLPQTIRFQQLDASAAATPACRTLVAAEPSLP